MLSEVSLSLEQESGRFESIRSTPRKDVEAIFDACFVALVTAVITYGICEAVARWRWWAVGIWVGTALLIPVAIAICRACAEFFSDEER